MTYAVLSDLHCHNWSTFSTPTPTGVGGRLQIILDEMMRAALAVLAHGGNEIVIPGDIFHVRGSVDPEVLNPVQDMVRQILDLGVSFLAIPGNHDLKGKNTTALGSAIQTLGETFSPHAAFNIYNKPELVFGPSPKAFVPWFEGNDHLLAEIEKLAKLAGNDVGDFDLFIHAGIDGVLSGMPASGLTDGKLAGFGFRRVFAGHYHHHKDFGNGVCSVGATTHQSWRDVDTRAGFVIVDDQNKLRVFDTHAPKFVDVSGLDETDMQLAADGNYVRFRGQQMSIDQVRELREFLVAANAKGVSIQAPKPAVGARPQSARPAGKGLTLAQSVENFVDQTAVIPAHVDRAEVKRRAADVLATSQQVHEEA